MSLLANGLETRADFLASSVWDKMCRIFKVPSLFSSVPVPDFDSHLVRPCISIFLAVIRVFKHQDPTCSLTTGSGFGKRGLSVPLSDIQMYFVPINLTSTPGSGVCGGRAAGVSSANENHLAICLGQMEARWEKLGGDCGRPGAASNYSVIFPPLRPLQPARGCFYPSSPVPRYSKMQGSLIQATANPDVTLQRSSRWRSGHQGNWR